MRKRLDSLHQLGRELRSLAHDIGWLLVFGVLLTFAIPVAIVWFILSIPIALASFAVRGDWHWSSRMLDRGVDRYMTWMETSADRARPPLFPQP